MMRKAQSNSTILTEKAAQLDSLMRDSENAVSVITTTIDRLANVMSVSILLVRRLSLIRPNLSVWMALWSSSSLTTPRSSRSLRTFWRTNE